MMDDAVSSNAPTRRPRTRPRTVRGRVALLLFVPVGVLLLVTCVWASGSAQAAIAGSGGGIGSGSDATPAEATSSAPTTVSNGFRISGSVNGLFPGKVAPLALKVTNPQKFAIVVKSLSVSVSGASATCTAANVTVTSFSGALSVPAGGSAVATVQIALLHSAPNDCQGALFPLLYHGLATKP
jgi:P pilus assembly chaperone PapD